MVTITNDPKYFEQKILEENIKRIDFLLCVVLPEGMRMVDLIRSMSKSSVNVPPLNLQKKSVSELTTIRKTWIKFGKSCSDEIGPNSATTVVPVNEVNMEFKVNQKYPSVLCQNCLENHHTIECNNNSKLRSSETTSGVYVPPSRRMKEKESIPVAEPAVRKPTPAVPASLTTIKVSNLPDSVSEIDVRELCSPFGKIDKIRMPKNRKNLAFVTYKKKEDATKAIKLLHRYGYDHLILNVELT